MDEKMRQCFLCSNEATFRVEGYAESGQDGGFVYQPVCGEHIESYYDWRKEDDSDSDERIHGLEYITRIDNVAAGDRVKSHTRLKRISKSEFVMKDEEWGEIVCNLEFGPIICDMLTYEQLFVIALGLRERIFNTIAPKA